MEGEKMWKQKLKRFLVALLVLCLFSWQALAQAKSLFEYEQPEVQIDLNNFLEQDTINQWMFTPNLKSDSQNLTDSENKQEKSNQESMDASTLLNNQDKLLDSLENQWMNLELQVQTLALRYENSERTNKELSNMLLNSKATIQSLRKNLDDYKVALESNKEDTGYIVSLFADAQNEIADIKKYVAILERDKRKLKNVRITSAVTTGAGVALIALSQVVPDETAKKALFWTGVGTTAAGGITLGVSFAF